MTNLQCHNLFLISVAGPNCALLLVILQQSPAIRRQIATCDDRSKRVRATYGVPCVRSRHYAPAFHLCAIAMRPNDTRFRHGDVDTLIDDDRLMQYAAECGNIMLRNFEGSVQLLRNSAICVVPVSKKLRSR